MLFGKISPQAVIPKMITPFEQTEIVAEYIAAIATPYILGTHFVDFRVMYGNPVYNDENVMIHYNIIHETYVRLSGQEIEDWGTDDTVVLSTIATLEGTTITQFENWFPNNFS
jgi:hypothetical protein